MMMEKLKKINNKIIECVYEELEHNWDNINICELGEAVDMIKDLEKAIYYETIIKAMEIEPHTMEVKDWSIADDIEHKMPHMEAHKTDHS